MRVLVIEDDEELAETVAAGLRDARIAVDVALDGGAGLARAWVIDYDVIVLDRDLPVVHGDEVCAQLIAAGGRSRVLMLTGAAENEDLVAGLGSATTTTCPSRSRLLCSLRGSARWRAARSRASRRCWSIATSCSTPPGALLTAAASHWRCGPRSSVCWSCC